MRRAAIAIAILGVVMVMLGAMIMAPRHDYLRYLSLVARQFPLAPEIVMPTIAATYLPPATATGEIVLPTIAPAPFIVAAINDARRQAGLSALDDDPRLRQAAQIIAGDGSSCPIDRQPIEFVISRALAEAGYTDRYGYAYVACGRQADGVLEVVRPKGLDGRLEDIGVVYQGELGIWVVLMAQSR